MDSVNLYKVIFEDEFLILVNKPNDLLVHHSHYARNIREKSLTQQLREKSDIFPVHRLDRKTSGIMIFAKNQQTSKFIQEQFVSHSIHKAYYALVRGNIQEAGELNHPIRKIDGTEYKAALTAYQPTENIEVPIPVEPYETSRYCLMKLSPQTGRTHQLRKHMNKFAHPIIGDTKYGNRHHNRVFESRFNHSKLYLHARNISFKHPISGELSFKAAFPDYWASDLNSLGFKQDLELL